MFSMIPYTQAKRSRKLVTEVSRSNLLFDSIWSQFLAGVCTCDVLIMSFGLTKMNARHPELCTNGGQRESS